MARRKNVKRIDPRYFLNETVNRGEEIEDVATYPSDPRALKRAQVAAWQETREENEAEEKKRIAGGGDPSLGIRGQRPIDKKRRADAHAAWKAEQSKTELEEGCPHAEEPGEGGEAIDISAPGVELHVDDISQLSPEEAFAAGMAAARDAIDQVMGGGESPPEEAEALEEGIHAAVPAEPDWRSGFSQDQQRQARQGTAAKAAAAAAKAEEDAAHATTKKWQDDLDADVAECEERYQTAAHRLGRNRPRRKQELYNDYVRCTNIAKNAARTRQTRELKGQSAALSPNHPCNKEGAEHDPDCAHLPGYSEE